MPTEWSGRCSPGGATIVRQLPAARACDMAIWATLFSQLARLGFGADRAEGEVLEDPGPHAATGRQAAVEAIPVVVDELGAGDETGAVELAVDERGDPPAGDRVAPQLEEAGGHQETPASAPARSTSARRSRSGSASGGSVAGKAGAEATGERARERSGRRRRPPRSTAASAIDSAGAGACALARERGRAEARHPAGVDQVEVGEVGGDIEGDAVEADAARHADAERADLARQRVRRRRPSSPGARSGARLHPGGCAGVGHGALEGLHERPDPERAALEGVGRAAAGEASCRAGTPGAASCTIG